MPLARTTVAQGQVQPEFLPVELQRVPPATILRRLEDDLPQRRSQERDGLVVCHGDLCLPNLLIDPETLEVSGLIDLGRLGTADPYADIALLLANARETWLDEPTACRADRRFAEHYGIDLDAARQRFYLLLDPLTWPLSPASDATPGEDEGRDPLSLWESASWGYLASRMRTSWRCHKRATGQSVRPMPPRFAASESFWATAPLARSLEAAVLAPKTIDSGTSAEITAATSTRRAETLYRNPLVPKPPIDRFRDKR